MPAAFLKFEGSDGNPVIVNPAQVVYCTPDENNPEYTRIICVEDNVLVVHCSFKKVANDFPRVHRDQMGQRLYDYEM